MDKQQKIDFTILVFYRNKISFYNVQTSCYPIYYSHKFKVGDRVKFNKYKIFLLQIALKIGQKKLF